MDHQRPRGREKHVTGPGKSVNKRGEGLHTGPVGDAGGYADRKEPSGGSGQRSGGTRSGGGMKLLILLAVLLLGGGGGIGTLLSGQSTGQTGPAQQQQAGQLAGGDLSALLGGLNGGSVSSGWQSKIGRAHV